MVFRIRPTRRGQSFDYSARKDASLSFQIRRLSSSSDLDSDGVQRSILSPTAVGFIFIFNVNLTNLMSTSGAAMLFTESAQNGTNTSIKQPRVDVSSEKRRQLTSISHLALAQLTICIVTAQEHVALTEAADLNTIARITQIWADRLQLTSVYVSCQNMFSNCATRTQCTYLG